MFNALAEDVVAEYPLCVELHFAGKDYRVCEIACFVSDVIQPRDDFILVRQYNDRFLQLLVRTEQGDLLEEAMTYVDAILPGFDEIELHTPFLSVLRSESICRRFAVGESCYPPNPDYVIRSLDQLRPSAASCAAGVTIGSMSDGDRAVILRAAVAGQLDRDGIGPDLFRPLDRRRDVRWYWIHASGEPIGYLRAECVLQNVEEIGWLYVESKYRGRGYAAALVRAFTRDSFLRGRIPRYGYAVSPESERVAQACGYVRADGEMYCRSLRKR
jgi:predicted GNAT family acetyltransferase